MIEETDPLKKYLKPEVTQRDNTSIVQANKKPTLKELASNKIEYLNKQKAEIARRKNAIAYSNKVQNNAPLSREAFATTAIGDKARLFPNDANSTFDEYINPVKMIGDMADNLGHAFADKDANWKDKVLAVGAPLLTGALGGIGAKTTGEFVNNVMNPIAGINLKSPKLNIPSTTNEFIPMKPQLFNWDKWISDGNHLSSVPEKKSLIDKMKGKVNTAMDAKFIPVGSKQILPNKIEFKVDGPADYTDYSVRAIGDDGNIHGYLGLESYNKEAYMVDGVRKDANYVSANSEELFRMAGFDRVHAIKRVSEPTGWAKPNYIKVMDKMQGKRLQDVLYQIGIDEGKKLGFKGIRSGDELLSPAKTVKVHNRFEKEVFDMKNTDGVEHLVAGLTGHTNPNVVKDWLADYAKIKKTETIKMSMNDVRKKVDDLPGELSIPLFGGVGLAAGATMLYRGDKDERLKIEKINKYLKDKDKLK